MPSPEQIGAGPPDLPDPPPTPPFRPAPDSRGANTDWLRLIAAAADLCRRPLRHAVLAAGGDDAGPAAAWHPGLGELCLRLEVRDDQGHRCPHQDLELEIYRSGRDLNLTLAWCLDQRQPMLWQGSHPLWIDAQGRSCPPPADGQPLEALARRLRALLLAG